MSKSPRQKDTGKKAYKLQSRSKLRAQIKKLKESQPCMDCGFYYPAPLMEYDHRPGVKKRATVARLVQWQYSWKIIKAEVDKCDLVCANCHRYRTHCSRDKTFTPSTSPVIDNLD